MSVVLINPKGQPVPVFTIKEDRYFSDRTPFTIYREGAAAIAAVDEAAASQARDALAASEPTVGDAHGASISEQIRLATSLVGTDDKNGRQELRDIVAYLGRLALSGLDLERIRAIVKAHDKRLDDDEKPGGATAPTGDDYNEIFGFIMDGAPSDAVRGDLATLRMQLEEAQDFLVANFGPAESTEASNPRRWSDEDAFALYVDNAAALSAAEAVAVVSPSAAGSVLAALKTARDLIDEAVCTHIYGDDEEQPEDCNYAAGYRQIEAAIALIEGQEAAASTKFVSPWAALEAAQFWLQEEAASTHPGQTKPGDILRVIGDALAGRPMAPLTSDMVKPDLASQCRFLVSVIGTHSQQGRNEARQTALYIGGMAMKMLASLKTLSTQARSVIDTVNREDVPEWFSAVESAELTIAAAEASEAQSPGDASPNAEDKPRFVIVISEGVVTDVVSDDPVVIGTPYATIDHDTEGLTPGDKVVLIPQQDEATREGYIRENFVAKAEFPISPASIYEPAPGYDDEGLEL